MEGELKESIQDADTSERDAKYVETFSINIPAGLLFAQSKK